MQNPLAPRRVVLVHPLVRDPALSDDMDFDAYVETRNPDLVIAKEGMTPTWFELTPLKSEWVMDRVNAEPVGKRYAICFLGACHKVEMPGDTKLAQTRTVPSGQKVADIAWAKAIAAKFGLRAVEELGSLAWQLTQVPEGYEGPFF